MKKILFQGDSITDKTLSAGYPIMVEGSIGVRYPNQYVFENEGISGNRSVDILARVKKDIINRKPDYLSILVGVNDVWHEFGQQNGVSVERYQQYYDVMIEQIREALPDSKIMIMEPFTLKGIGNEEYYEAFRSEVEKRGAAAARVAKKYELPFIELQKEFDKAAKLAPNEFWLRDGVHPTYAGHKLIADQWLAMFEKIK